MKGGCITQFNNYTNKHVSIDKLEQLQESVTHKKNANQVVLIAQCWLIHRNIHSATVLWFIIYLRRITWKPIVGFALISPR